MFFFETRCRIPPHRCRIPTKKVSHSWGNATPNTYFLTVFLSPSRRRAAFFLFEHMVEMGTGREATLGRNDVITEVGLSNIIFLASSKRTSASQRRKVVLRQDERYRDNSFLEMFSERDRVNMFTVVSFLRTTCQASP